MSDIRRVIELMKEWRELLAQKPNLEIYERSKVIRKELEYQRINLKHEVKRRLPDEDSNLTESQRKGLEATLRSGVQITNSLIGVVDFMGQRAIYSNGKNIPLPEHEKDTPNKFRFLEPVGSKGEHSSWPLESGMDVFVGAAVLTYEEIMNYWTTPFTGSLQNQIVLFKNNKIVWGSHPDTLKQTADFNAGLAKRFGTDQVEMVKKWQGDYYALLEGDIVINLKEAKSADIGADEIRDQKYQVTAYNKLWCAERNSFGEVVVKRDNQSVRGEDYEYSWTEDQGVRLTLF